MKKKSKRGNSFKQRQDVMSIAESPDMASLIGRIQQQLIVLERKVDTLISRSQERSFGNRERSQPFQRFERPMRQERKDQGHGYRERFFTRAICAECNKECEVPFKPSGDRPVYCNECFAERKKAVSLQEKHNIQPKETEPIRASAFYKEQERHGRKSGKKRRESSRKRK